MYGSSGYWVTNHMQQANITTCAMIRFCLSLFYYSSVCDTKAKETSGDSEEDDNAGPVGEALSPCSPALGPWLLDRALRMPSGVMSTRDRMLASGFGADAPPGDGMPAFTVEPCVDGVVGVPGEGRDTGLTPKIRRTLAG